MVKLSFKEDFLEFQNDIVHLSSLSHSNPGRWLSGWLMSFMNEWIAAGGKNDCPAAAAGLDHIISDNHY